LIFIIVPFVEYIAYATRSTQSEENEQVVEETMDRHGVEWDIITLNPHDHESLSIKDQCFFLPPSQSLGNGIFISIFKIKRQIATDTTQEPEAIVIVEDKSINAIEKKKERKQRRLINENQTQEPVHRRIPKRIAAAMVRLSVPRLYRTTVNIQRRSSNVDVNVPDFSNLKIESFGKVSERESIQVSEREESTHKPDVIKKFRKGNFDIGIFGASLKSFYSPRTQAIEVLKETAPNDLRWSYPVFYKLT
jgi:hypothetical protein